MACARNLVVPLPFTLNCRAPHQGVTGGAGEVIEGVIEVIIAQL